MGNLEDGALVGVARSAEHAVQRIAAQGREKVGAALEVPRSYVRENPLQSVLVAVGVGALVGYLIGRRR